MFLCLCLYLTLYMSAYERCLIDLHVTPLPPHLYPCPGEPITSLALNARLAHDDIDGDGVVDSALVVDSSEGTVENKVNACVCERLCVCLLCYDL